MKKRLRVGLSIAALGMVALAVAVALRPQPFKVESARVDCGSLQVTIEAEGKTRVRDRFVVAAPVAGRLARIVLRRGDVVERGAAIARIEPLPLAPLDPRQHAEANAHVAAAQALRLEAEALVGQLRADCEQGRRELARAERLVETGDIARQEFERARNAEITCGQQLAAAQFKARAAAAEIEAAKAALLAVERAGQSGTAATVIVSAPVRGRVLQLLEESERVVVAGAPLVELSNPSHLEVAIEVLSTDAVKVRPGTPVIIEEWGGETTLRAQVRLIEPAAFTKVSALGVEEQRVNIIADFIDAASPLGDGYRVEARLVLWEAPDVRRLPASALYREGQDWNVFVIEGGRARERAVKIGHRAAFEVEVLEGLDEGAEVILHPNNQIVDGARVTTQ